MAIRHCADTSATPAVFPGGMAASVFFGLDGVLYSMPVSDILTFAVALFLIRGTYKELNEQGGKTAARAVPVRGEKKRIHGYCIE